jgi:hypothetical protein
MASDKAATTGGTTKHRTPTALNCPAGATERAPETLEVRHRNAAGPGTRMVVAVNRAAMGADHGEFTRDVGDLGFRAGEEIAVRHDQIGPRKSSKSAAENTSISPAPLRRK